MGYNALDITGTTASTGNLTDTETTLYQATLDANKLSNSSDAIHVIAWGSVANNANVKTLKFYFGTASQSFVLPADTATSWKLDVWLSGVSQTSQSGVATLLAGVIATATADVFLIASTQDTKNSQVVKLTGTATDSNDILLKGMIIRD